MTDLLFQIALSNVCISLALAIVAVVVEATAKRPALAHLLWLLVFVKLLTPPVVTIPIVTFPGQPDSAVVAIKDHSQQGLPVATSPEFSSGNAKDAYPSAETRSVILEHGKAGLSLIWLLGSVFVFAWSLVRVYRFNRLLGMESDVAPQELQTVAARIANALGLKAVPTIYTTSAHLSPMVWWIGGRVRIVIPLTVLDQMGTQQSQWILAHEIAHVRRRDYLVRWIEWLACVCFWWNPLVWRARHHLRANEELCCDALVVSSLKPRPHTYADSLLTAVECLACPALRPPAMASEINSGGLLERRFGMIVSGIPNRSRSRWLQACVLLLAAVVLPLGIASAQDYEAVAKRLNKAVKKREITQQHADAMMTTLKRMGQRDSDRNPRLNERGGDRKRITREDYARAEADLRKAVATGRISEEDARVRLNGMRKMMGEQRDRGKEMDWQAIRRRIEGAVESGRMTREEADAKYREIKRQMAGEGNEDERVAKYRAIEARIRAAVKAGKVSREDAERRLVETRKHMFGGERSSKAREDKDVWAKLQAQVKAGKMSAEDAKAKMATIKKAKLGSKAKTDAYFKKVWAKLQAQVEAGKMSAEDARAKMAAIKKRAAAKAKTDAYFKEVWAKLQAQVEAGKMSAKDAKAKMAAIKKEAAAKAKAR